jgi:hypothetical protein
VRTALRTVFRDSVRCLHFTSAAVSCCGLALSASRNPSRSAGDADSGGLPSRALELAGPKNHFARGAASGFLGLAAWAAGDLHVAVDTFSAPVASLHAAGNLADELGTTVVLANMWLARGQPSQARRRYERALVAAERQPDIALPVTADMHVGLADMLREQTEIDAAAAHQQTAGAISLPPATPRPTSSESLATSTTRSCASDSTTNAHSRTSDAIATSRGWPR